MMFLAAAPELQEHRLTPVYAQPQNRASAFPEGTVMSKPHSGSRIRLTPQNRLSPANALILGRRSHTV